MEYQQSWEEHNDMFAVLSNVERKTKEEIVSNAIKKGLMTNLLKNLQGYPLKELWKLEKN